MNKTGIIRKIDELGRIVLPKELRKTLNIKAGDDLLISIESNKIILEKYVLLESFEEIINKIVFCFFNITNYNIYVSINDFLTINNQKINNKYISLIEERKVYIDDKINNHMITKEIINNGKIVIQPMVIDSDLIGSIIIVANDQINKMIDISKIIFNIIKEFIIFD